MANKKGSSKGRKAQLGAYKLEGRSLKNRTLRLKAYSKRNPFDQQAQSALDKGLVEYRRKRPMNPVWTPPKIRYAQMIAFVGGNGHDALKQKTHS